MKKLKRRKLTADKLARSLRHGAMVADAGTPPYHYLPPTVRNVQLSPDVVLEAKLARLGRVR